MEGQSPILNSPYEEPAFHYHTDPFDNGALDYNDVRKGRRIFIDEALGTPVRQGAQRGMFEINDFAEDYASHLVNMLRREVKSWREAEYPNTTRVTKELLTFWFTNPERSAIRKLFFCQREAVETAVWLNEVAARSNPGQHVLQQLDAFHKEDANGLPRIAFKMATGTGKTVVMAMLILYHYFNRQEYSNDTRFADYFLIVTPGITIRDRLGVLRIDTEAKNRQTASDYYRVRDLIPKHLEQIALNLNSRIVITNYHTFEARTLKGNKRSPFDGKIGKDGKKQIETESPALVIKRVMGSLKTGRRLLVLNDEAHHCYLPKDKGQRVEGEDTKQENERAAVWFSGLLTLADHYKIQNVYDLSATPYYLTGSGYEPYSLFRWVVSDFGLIEAIEAGLVKIPFLPESDSTQQLDMPVLRNLYDHVRDQLPKQGQKRRRKKDEDEKSDLTEPPPRIPDLVKTALQQFYEHYHKAYHSEGAGQTHLLDDRPPVFIVVCNNTSVSREIFKYIAGYETEIISTGEVKVVPGRYDLFSNFDKETGSPFKKPPTLLIDSDALENSDQIDSDFKRVFASEIKDFKKDYARIYGAGSAENVTDAQILREVVNTVGEPGKLGAHIRCVVSVSMLTEGWDANTVSHIMGLRAFGSHLLSEQVAGRALRRRNYNLARYDKNRMPNSRGSLELFPPEYAHIIGIPFRFFKGAPSSPAPSVEHTHVAAIPDREAEYEITFPNLDGYRIEHSGEEITADFSGIEHFEVDATKYPLETVMASAFLPDEQEMNIGAVKELRDQQLFYLITKELIGYFYSDDEGLPHFQKFNQLKRIVEQWYRTRVKLVGHTDQNYRRMLYFFDPKKICDHIQRGIEAGSQKKGTRTTLPIFNYYNKFGSTKYVNGHTSKPVLETEKSHVNYVVADTESWEQKAAKALEEMNFVQAYVKNEFLGFTIPYVAQDGQERLYYPDFIARCLNDQGKEVNLIIEITGMNRDKAEKKWYVENNWLPAINAVRDKYEYAQWEFIEIANDIRDIKNQVNSIIQNVG